MLQKIATPSGLCRTQILIRTRDPDMWSRMAIQRYAILAFAAASLGLTSCQVFNRGGDCPPMFPVELVYPASGSVGVPTNLGVVVVQGAIPSNSDVGAFIIAPSGAILTGGPVERPPSPLPSPLATPPDVLGDSYAALPLPTLQPHKTYTFNVQQQIGVDTGCVAIGKTAGYFSTK